MAIILGKFRLIIFLFLLLLFFSYGMESGGNDNKSLMKSSSLNPFAESFNPQFSRTLPAGHGSSTMMIPFAEHSSPRQLLTENLVVEGEEGSVAGLPDDPFETAIEEHVSMIREENQQRMAERHFNATKHNTKMALFLKQLRPHGDYFIAPYKYDQFSKAASSNTNSSQKNKSIQKSGGKERKKNWRERIEEKLQENRNELRKERRKQWILGANKSRDKIPDEFSHGKEESNDENLSSEPQNTVVVPSDEVSRKLEDYDKIKTDQEKYPSVVKALHQTPAEQQQEFHAAASSTINSMDKLNIYETTKKMTEMGSTKKAEAGKQQNTQWRGKEKSNEASKPITIPKGVEEIKKKKGGTPQPAGKTGGVKKDVKTSPVKTIEKQRLVDPPYNSSPKSSHGNAVDKSDKRGVVKTYTNPFEALRETKENASEEHGSAVQLKQAHTIATIHTRNSSDMPVSPPFPSSGTSGSNNKVKAVVTDKKIQEEKSEQDTLQSKVDSIVRSVHQLEKDKAKCLKIPDVEKENKVAKISKLMDAYLKIMRDLKEFYKIHSENKENSIYIGDIFNWMNDEDKESAIKPDLLTQTMEECLVYLDGNLKNFKNEAVDLDNILYNIERLKNLLNNDDVCKEASKSELIRWYTHTLERKIYDLLSYLVVGPNVNATFSRNEVFAAFLVLYTVFPNRQDEFMQARQTIDKYMEMVQRPEKDDHIEQIRYDEKNCIPSESAGASNSKGDASMTDKKEEKELKKGFYSTVNKIVKSVENLEKIKTECIKIPVEEKNKQKKGMKVSKLMRDYNEIMGHLEAFSDTYYKDATWNTSPIVYIGQLFIMMDRDHHKAILIDMLQIMQESLAYLDQNLGKSEDDLFDFKHFFENVDIFKDYILLYENAAKTGDPSDIEQAKTTMIKWYTNTMESEYRDVLLFIFVDISNDVNFDIKLSAETLTIGLSKLAMALPNRRKDFLGAIIPAEKYFKIVPNGQIGEKHLSEDILKLDKDIEYVVKLITTLEQEQDKCSKIEDSAERMKLKEELKRNYKLIVMESLNNFVNDYGEKYEKPRNFFYFTGVINWIVKLYKGEKEIKAKDLQAKMESFVQFLQENNEEVTNFSDLLQKIDQFKEKCDDLEKSEGDFKEQTTRDRLQQLGDFYHQQLDPQLREAIGYVYIGIQQGKQGEQMEKDKVGMGLKALKNVALPKYTRQLEESVSMMNKLFILLHRYTLQEIRDNLTEYVTKMLGIHFDSGSIIDTLDELADKFAYPPVYKGLAAGLIAIDELISTAEKETKKMPIDSPTSSSKSKASSKKGKKQAVAAKMTDEDNANWVEMLSETKKLIHYVCILMQIEDAWGKSPEKLVFGQTVYEQAWTILYLDELLPTMATYYKAKNMNTEKHNIIMSSVVKFYSYEIINFTKHLNKANKVKGNKIQDAMQLLSELYDNKDMGHRFKHFRKWLNLEEKLDAKLICDCTMYN